MRRFCAVLHPVIGGTAAYLGVGTLGLGSSRASYIPCDALSSLNAGILDKDADVTPSAVHNSRKTMREALLFLTSVES